jgi:hypothetical protein
VYVITQLGWILTGPLVTVGLVTLVTLLFLTALSGAPRPSQQIDADPTFADRDIAEP